MIYIIRLSFYKIDVSIGIHDFEREKVQPVEIDIDLMVDYAKNVVSTDSIDAAVDYDFLREKISEMVAGRHFELQETLCKEIYDFCKSKESVSAARVYLRKTSVYPDCDSVGVEIRDKGFF